MTHRALSAPLRRWLPDRLAKLPSLARRRLATAAALLAAGMLVLPTARAAWPEKPITLIVAYAAGGGSDMIVRLLAPHLERYLGNGARIVVVNRTGAGGAIGFSELAAAAPDGYTIGMINTPNVLTIPIERKSSFSWRSFELLGNLVDDPGNFSVHRDTGIRTLAELAAEARAKPGALTVGTTGVGSDDHLGMLFFERAMKVRMNHIPFKGSAEVRTAVQGRQIDVASMNIGEALQYEKSGTPIRQLGTMSVERTALSPDVPTFREQGVDAVLSSLRGLAAPKGMPPAVRDALVSAVERAVADPKFRADAAAAFAPLRYLAPPAYETELRESEAGFRKLWDEAPWADK